jgi:hypothetical protein
MTVVGLDLNATRARAVYGHGAGAPAGLDLEDRGRELPMAVSLEGRAPVVGRPGSALCRRAPHFACTDFLPALGRRREWVAGRCRVDAARALALAFDHLHHCFGRADGVFVAVPPYLDDGQEVLLTQIAARPRRPLLGTITAPAAAALAAHERAPWAGTALVLDVDGHALTCSAVAVESDAVRLVHSHPLPHLALGAWLGRLLNGVAGRCVRLSRRDPRESADGEQGLYDQLADRLAGADADGGLLELSINATHWHQHLMMHPDELAAFCLPLVEQALAEFQAFAATGVGPAAVLLTAAAGALPGLAAALDDFLQAPAVERAAPPQAADGGDFGEGLSLDDGAAAPRAVVLDADAVARAAHDLAGRVRRGELPRGRCDTAPLRAEPAFAGDDPPRLEFRGRGHVLTAAVFTLGRDPACDLVFETELYPSVSARHCDIVLDRNAYLVRDRSRHGTLLNEEPVRQQAPLRSGDWIRLGPGGPVLRFMGRPAEDRCW